MDPTALLTLLVTGAGLVASNAAGDFGKSAGKAAFEALKARLSGTHAVASLNLLEKAKDQPAFAEAIRTELAAPEVMADAALLPLAETLRDAIGSLEPAAHPRFAVEIETIRSGGLLLIEGNQGVVAKLAESAGDMIIRNNKLGK